MDIQNVKLFVALADRLSFSETAKMANMNQATLSRRIQKLEADLKTTLFYRRGKSVSLTPQGEVFLKSARDIIAAVESAESCLTEEPNMLAGSIRVGCLAPMAKLIISEVLPDFSRRYPHIDIHFHIVTPNNLRMVEDMDLLITPKQPKEQHVVSYSVGGYRCHCYASKRYLTGKQPILYPHDLEFHDCIAHANADGYEHYWPLQNELNQLRNIKVGGKYTASTYDVAAELAIGGFGVALLPTAVVEQNKAGSELVDLFNGAWFKAGQTYINRKQNMGVSVRIMALIEYLKMFFESRSPAAINTDGHKQAS